MSHCFWKTNRLFLLVLAVPPLIVACGGSRDGAEDTGGSLHGEDAGSSLGGDEAGDSPHGEEADVLVANPQEAATTTGPVDGPGDESRPDVIVVPPGDHPDCGAAVHVTTADQAKALIEPLALGFRTVQADGKNLSSDLLFDADVELDAAQFTLPDCGNATCPPLDIELGSDAGTCIESLTADGGSGGTTCARFGVHAGASLRVLKVLLGGGFFSSPASPTLLAVASCNVPCSGGQRRCAAIQVCMGPTPPTLPIDPPVSGVYCSTCLGESAPQCACFTFDGPQPDGAACSFFTSDDTGSDGKCQAGTCQ